jgi:hypothetical protein
MTTSAFLLSNPTDDNSRISSPRPECALNPHLKNFRQFNYPGIWKYFVAHPKWKMTSRVMPKRAKRVYCESVVFQRGGAKYRAIVISTTGLEASRPDKPSTPASASFW